MAWADSRRESGYRDRLIWFTPEEVAGLAQLQEDNPGKSLADVVSAAVVQASSIGLASMTPPIVPDFAVELEEIKARLAILEEAAQVSDHLTAIISTESSTDDLVADQAELVDQVVDADPLPADAGRRITKGSAAYVRLLDLIANRIAEEGDGFSRVNLHRDIQAAGHKVPGLPRNFATFVKNNMAEALDVLAQRQQRAA